MMFVRLKQGELTRNQHLYGITQVKHDLKTFVSVFIVPQFTVDIRPVFANQCPRSVKDLKFIILHIDFDALNLPFLKKGDVIEAILFHLK